MREGCVEAGPYDESKFAEVFSIPEHVQRRRVLRLILNNSTCLASPLFFFSLSLSSSFFLFCSLFLTFVAYSFLFILKVIIVGSFFFYFPPLFFVVLVL